LEMLSRRAAFSGNTSLIATCSSYFSFSFQWRPQEFALGCSLEGLGTGVIHWGPGAKPRRWNSLQILFTYFHCIIDQNSKL